MGGLRLESITVAVGERLRLSFTLPQPDGQSQRVEIEGTVRWSDGSAAGLHFDDLSDSSDFAAIYAAIAVLR